MNLEALKTFIAIVELGSFASAARALALSQSAISLHIKMVEKDLGKPLFDRSTRPPKLTDAGTVAVAFAKDLLGHVEDFRSCLTSALAVSGRLRLGAVGSTLTGLVPLTLSSLRAQHPSLHVEVISGFSDELLHLVEHRRIDAAIVSDYDGAQRHIQWRPFLVEPLVLAAPPGTRERNIHRLAQCYPFIRYSPTAAVGRLIDKAVKHAGLNVRETMQLDWLDAIEVMVHYGHGISIIPERRLKGASEPRLKRIPMGGTPFHRTLGLIELAAHDKHLMTEALIGHLRGVSRKPGPRRASLKPELLDAPTSKPAALPRPAKAKAGNYA